MPPYRLVRPTQQAVLPFTYTVTEISGFLMLDFREVSRNKRFGTANARG
jgi:hypothetical protein